MICNEGITSFVVGVSVKGVTTTNEWMDVLLCWCAVPARYDRIQRPGRSQQLLLSAWNAFHFAWPLASQLVVLAATCFLGLDVVAAKRAPGSGVFAVVFVGLLSIRYVSVFVGGWFAAIRACGATRIDMSALASSRG